MVHELCSVLASSQIDSSCTQRLGVQMRSAQESGVRNIRAPRLPSVHARKAAGCSPVQCPHDRQVKVRSLKRCTHAARALDAIRLDHHHSSQAGLHAASVGTFCDIPVFGYSWYFQLANSDASSTSSTSFRGPLLMVVVTLVFVQRCVQWVRLLSDRS
ncbi:hypothetical protein BD413DRAFT_187904 [Trametes elegans]|nr:hypothetical protein BD413DRAFT_187904 [Trametes elegans]